MANLSVAKKPRPSKRGENMVLVAQTLFKRYEFGANIDQDTFVKALEKNGRKLPKGRCLITWRNDERYKLNKLGTNNDLLVKHDLKPFQLDSVRSDLLELRKPENSLLFYDQMKRTMQSIMVASKRAGDIAQFVEHGDKRLAIQRNVNRLASSVTAAYLPNEETRQRLLAKEDA